MPIAAGSAIREERWPPLPLEAWQETCTTLQLWTQIVGKVRLSLTPWTNHSWHVAFYVTPCGLTTSPIPHGARTFQIDFDLLRHRLVIETSEGATRELGLRPMAVADFFRELMDTLQGLDLGVRIHSRPNEVEEAIPFPADRSHASYDPAAVLRFHRVLVQADRIFKAFRARFIGKCSPVHFFWGSFDLAVTRFSGRRAPPHPGGIVNLPDAVVRDAYSHEVSSAGFWPGGGPHPYPLFYSYAVPEPEGFRERRVGPEGAFFSEALGEFVLPYDAVRSAEDPDAALLQFLQESYEAAADCGAWDRSELERSALP